LLKCDTSSYGCDGGYINTALKLAITKGMPLDYVYPYTATTFYTTTMCTDAYTLKHIFGSTPYTYFNTQQKMSDAAIINLLARGPVLATVCADDWFYYKPSPTQRTMSCSWWYSTSYSQINHAILIVGYTETEWIIKNSWGAIWGLDGFIYVSRNQSYNCGIGFELYTIASPKPPSAY
jgi:C1A family cysteine protease